MLQTRGQSSESMSHKQGLARKEGSAEAASAATANTPEAAVFKTMAQGDANGVDSDFGGHNVPRPSTVAGGRNVLVVSDRSSAFRPSSRQRSSDHGMLPDDTRPPRLSRSRSASRSEPTTVDAVSPTTSAPLTTRLIRSSSGKKRARVGALQDEDEDEEEDDEDGDDPAIDYDQDKESRNELLEAQRLSRARVFDLFDKLYQLVSPGTLGLRAEPIHRGRNSSNKQENILKRAAARIEELRNKVEQLERAKGLITLAFRSSAVPQVVVTGDLCLVDFNSEFARYLNADEEQLRYFCQDSMERSSRQEPYKAALARTALVNRLAPSTLFACERWQDANARYIHSVFFPVEQVPPVAMQLAAPPPLVGLPFPPAVHTAMSAQSGVSGSAGLSSPRHVQMAASSETLLHGGSSVQTSPMQLSAVGQNQSLQQQLHLQRLVMQLAALKQQRRMV